MKLLTFALLISGLTASIPSFGQPFPVIPVPQNFTIDSIKFLNIPENPGWFMEGATPEIEALMEDINKTTEGAHQFYLSDDEKVFIKLFIDPDLKIGDKMEAQAYELRIQESGIVITAQTTQGLVYGLMTALQLIDNAVDNQLPHLYIQDWPEMAWRGVSDDIARGQVSTLENFKRIIRFMARYKMNIYMPYVEDALAIAAFPAIGKDRGALTRDEAEALVDYAALYHIEIIPVIQTLGHFENILSLDEFKHLAEFPGAAALSVANDSTYIFLEKVMEEIFDIFPTSYFHMGADESYDVGQGQSAAMATQSSLAEIHFQHYKKVYDIAKKHGKTVLMYSDILLDHKEILEQLPKDIILVDWHYRAEKAYPSLQMLKGKGFETLVSPSVWNFLTPFPTYVNALPNIEYITRAGIDVDAKGMINSNWGDYGSETFKELVLYGYAWSAQCSWHMAGSQPDDFSQAFFQDFFGINDPQSAEIYQVLSNPLNQMLWNEFWRHPALEDRIKAWWEPNIATTGKIAWQELTLPQVRRKIEALRPLVNRNQDHLMILDFIMDLTLWYQQKLKWQLALNQPPENFDKDMIHSGGTFLQQNLKSLEQQFEKIWLSYYKEDNLWMIKDKFSRMQQYIEETHNIALKDNKLIDPEITSDWIYHPDSLKQTEFSYTFTVAGNLQEAKLQLLADTHAQLFINGEKVTEISGRRSLSLLDDYRRIAFLPIGQYLQPGKNAILVHVNNYNRKGAAGANVIVRMRYANGNAETLRSDENWEAKDPRSNGIKQAQKRKYSQTTIAPNFDTDRTSWFER